MRILEGVTEIRAAVGTDLGTGSWTTVTQPMIDDFAAVTGDRQWIHVDPDRAAAGPFGGTIAHGYLTLALLPLLLSDAFEIAGFRMKVNYGLDRVRLPAPVPVGSRLRAQATLTSVEATGRGERVVVRTTVQIDGTDAPACVADTVSLLVT